MFKKITIICLITLIILGTAVIAGSNSNWLLYTRPNLSTPKAVYQGIISTWTYLTQYYLSTGITMGDRDYLQPPTINISSAHYKMQIGFTIVDTQQQHLTLHVVPEGGLYPIYHQHIFVSNNLNSVMVEINTSTWPAGNYVITLDPEKTGKFSQWFVKRYNYVPGCPYIGVSNIFDSSISYQNNILPQVEEMGYGTVVTDTIVINEFSLQNQLVITERGITETVLNRVEVLVLEGDYSIALDNMGTAYFYSFQQISNTWEPAFLLSFSEQEKIGTKDNKSQSYTNTDEAIPGRVYSFSQISFHEPKSIIGAAARSHSDTQLVYVSKVNHADILDKFLLLDANTILGPMQSIFLQIPSDDKEGYHSKKLSIIVYVTGTYYPDGE